jgi:regulatory protein YycI of two-component signal transduction system YycFG
MVYHGFETDWGGCGLNWGGTKWILIVVFLVLNLFLGFQLWQKTSAHPELANSYEYSLDELLYLHRITLNTELDPGDETLAQLEVSSVLEDDTDLLYSAGQEVEIKENLIRSVLSPPYQWDGEFDSRSFRDNFLKKYIYRSEEYRLESVGQNAIRYVQYYQDLPLFISELEIAIDRKRQLVTGYQQLYFRVLSEGVKQPIIPSFAGLISLIEQQAIPPYATITDVTLGYYGHPYDAEQQVLTPTWRITFQDDGIYKVSYVNAYTGAIELDPNQADEVMQDDLALFHTGKR